MSTESIQQHDAPLDQHYDAVIVGAGFAGISSLFHLRKIGLKAIILEASEGVGGTWFNNRYPGARCDIESLDYSLSLSESIQQEWKWPERYSDSRSIQNYLDYTVDELELRENIRLRTTVTDATYDEMKNRWTTTTGDGSNVGSKFLVLATGVLSAAQMPEFPGHDLFTGRILHTASWPKDPVDFTNRRVAVIGTGSSATQLIPLVAEQASQLTVFQRTANFVMPARNGALEAATDQEWKSRYAERRAKARASSNGHNQEPPHGPGKNLSPSERDRELESRWEAGGLNMMRAFTDLLTDTEVNDYACRFVANKIRQTVQDPETAERLIPVDLPIGTKRLCSGTNYYETFIRPNVSLVSVAKEPIKGISEQGMIVGDTHYEFDDIIMATGFDAMTGSFLRIRVVGRNGQTLQDHWEGGPRTNLGLMTDGFPNLFFLSGPQTPSVFSNMATTSEMHAEWLARFLGDLGTANLGTIEPTQDSVDAWVDHVTETASKTLYADSRNSWFWGANTPGKPRVFMPYTGGVENYNNFLSNSVNDNYSGFVRA